MRLTKCKICRTPFQKRSIAHKLCGNPECAVEWAVTERAKKDRAKLREDKAKAKTRSQWLKEAQIAFNAYIRERDKDMPCISCGRFHTGSYDAGHYRSVGACPSLRFEESNCHRQCVPCNQHKSGNVIEYRIRLLERIGLERVEWLESNHEPKKYTIADAMAIKAMYRAKLRELNNK